MHDLIQFITAHWMLVLAFIAVIILLIREEANRAGQQFSPQAVSFKMNDGDAVLVDIRDAATFKQGHIAGSINVPMNQFKSQLSKLEPYKQQMVILVCNQGVSAQKAATILGKQKFSDIAILKGGIRAWLSEGFPTVKK